MATSVAKEALRALAQAVADDDGLPLTDRERADLAAKLGPSSRNGGRSDGFGLVWRWPPEQWLLE